LWGEFSTEPEEKRESECVFGRKMEGR
jgi:hypothetical protein